MTAHAENLDSANYIIVMLKFTEDGAEASYAS